MGNESVLKIGWAPPTLGEWNRLGRWGQSRLKKDIYPLIERDVRASGIEKVPWPAIVYAHIYRKAGQRWDAKRKRFVSYHRKSDPANLHTLLNKCIIDALTEPRGRKWRGLRLIPDDSERYLTVMEPKEHLRADEDATVLIFRPREPQRKEE